MKLLVNLTNVHRDEQAILKDHLEDNSWQVEELSQDDINTLISLINDVLNKGISKDATPVYHLSLLALRSKLNK